MNREERGAPITITAGELQELIGSNYSNAYGPASIALNMMSTAADELRVLAGAVPEGDPGRFAMLLCVLADRLDAAASIAARELMSQRAKPSNDSEVSP